MNDLKGQTCLCGVELLLVDNNSNDHESTELRDTMKEFPSFTYIQEPREGLSYARNAGAATARGEYLGYVDDDCRVAPDWTETALEVITAQNRPDIFGGPYQALHISQSKPRWYKDQYGSAFLNRSAGLLPPYQYLSGGNFFIKRALLFELGGFDPRFGMRGKRIRYGEETDLMIRALNRNPRLRVYHEPRLLVLHTVRPENYSFRTLARKQFASGRASRQLQGMRHQGPAVAVAKVAVRTLFAIGVAALTPFRDRTAFPHPLNFLIEKCLIHLHAIGWHYEDLRTRK